MSAGGGVPNELQETKSTERYAAIKGTGWTGTYLPVLWVLFVLLLAVQPADPFLI